MPHMDGRELAERLRSRYPSVRILFLTGYSEDEESFNKLILPDTDFLLKPVSFDSLYNKILLLLS